MRRVLGVRVACRVPHPVYGRAPFLIRDFSMGEASKRHMRLTSRLIGRKWLAGPFPHGKGLFFVGSVHGPRGRSNPPDPFFLSKKSYGTLFATPYGAPYELERSLFSGWTQTVEDSFSMRNPLAGYAVSVTGTLALLALVTGFVPGGSNQSLEPVTGATSRAKGEKPSAPPAASYS